VIFKSSTPWWVKACAVVVLVAGLIGLVVKSLAVSLAMMVILVVALGALIYARGTERF
jgi:hypothetical protein